MTSPTSQQLVEDLLSCAICLEQFTQPKTLPCLHTFCLPCLQRHHVAIQKSGPVDLLLCPTCRDPCPLPQGGVANLRDDFKVTKLAELVQHLHKEESGEVQCANSRCQMCNKRGVTQWCKPCQKVICSLCAINHAETLDTQLHQVLPLSEKYDAEDDICTKEHLYCIQCAQHLTPFGDISNHQHHDLVDLDNEMFDPDSFRYLTTCLECKATDVQDKITFLKQSDVTADQMMEEIKCAISCHKGKLCQELEYQEKKLLSNVEEHFRSRKEASHKVAAQHAQNLQCIEELKSLASGLLGTFETSAIVPGQMKLTADIHKHLEEPVPNVGFAVNVGLNFEPADKLVYLGNISTIPLTMANMGKGTFWESTFNNGGMSKQRYNMNDPDLRDEVFQENQSYSYDASQKENSRTVDKTHVNINRKVLQDANGFKGFKPGSSKRMLSRRKAERGDTTLREESIDADIYSGVLLPGEINKKSVKESKESNKPATIRSTVSTFGSDSSPNENMIIHVSTDNTHSNVYDDDVFVKAKDTNGKNTAVCSKRKSFSFMSYGKKLLPRVSKRGISRESTAAKIGNESKSSDIQLSVKEMEQKANQPGGASGLHAYHVQEEGISSRSSPTQQKGLSRCGSKKRGKSVSSLREGVTRPLSAPSFSRPGSSETVTEAVLEPRKRASSTGLLIFEVFHQLSLGRSEDQR